jgi:hypothetical protein
VQALIGTGNEEKNEGNKETDDKGRQLQSTSQEHIRMLRQQVKINFSDKYCWVKTKGSDLILFN